MIKVSARNDIKVQYLLDFIILSFFVPKYKVGLWLSLMPKFDGQSTRSEYN